MATQKAQAVAQHYSRALIIGADTVVVLHDRMLGKPADDRDAQNMLRALSGESHQVITGVALLFWPEQSVNTFTGKTIVQFRTLTDQEIDRYIQTGEPRDKAGAYGIQGKGAVLVHSIHGDYNTVVGFPLTAFYEQLLERQMIE